MSKIEVKNLSVVYQTARGLVRALTGVSFTMNSGESLGLWGHSGCGKSTVIKALLGLPIDEPGWVSGEARHEGNRISPAVEKYVWTRRDGTIYKNSLGFYRAHQRLLKPYLGVRWRSVFQEPIYSFDCERPVGLQVAHALGYLARRDSVEKERLFDEFADILGCLNLQPAYIRSRRNLELSGGECQRISLAMSIVGKPQVLFADEPTTAMDQRTRAQVNALLADKIKTTRMSLLIASHNREELLTLANNVVVLCQGMVVEHLSRDYLRSAPNESLHPYTRKLWFAADEEEAQPPGAGFRREDGTAKGCPHTGDCPFPQNDPGLADRCRNDRPPFFDVEDGHAVSCWLHRNAAEIER